MFHVTPEKNISLDWIGFLFLFFVFVINFCLFVDWSDSDCCKTNEKMSNAIHSFVFLTLSEISRWTRYSTAYYKVTLAARWAVSSSFVHLPLMFLEWLLSRYTRTRGTLTLLSSHKQMSPFSSSSFYSSFFIIHKTTHVCL